MLLCLVPPVLLHRDVAQHVVAGKIVGTQGQLCAEFRDGLVVPGGLIFAKTRQTELVVSHLGLGIDFHGLVEFRCRFIRIAGLAVRPAKKHVVDLGIAKMLQDRIEQRACGFVVMKEQIRFS